MVSKAERDYIQGGVEQGIRADGRGHLDFRLISIETDILPQCNGSCRLTIGFSVDIICSIKVTTIDLYELHCFQLQ